MIKRREFVLVVCAGVLPAPIIGYAQRQQGKTARVGILSPLNEAAAANIVKTLRESLRELGWVEGRNLAIEVRFADGRYDRLPVLAADLAHINLDVLVTGATSGALAAKKATTTIPIVAVTTGDPVASGLVASLARPGGNLTGVTALGRELSAKRLSLLKETLPGVSRVAVVSNPNNSETGAMLNELHPAARILGLQLHVLEVRGPTEFEQAFATLSRGQSEAVMVLTDPIFLTNRRLIVEHVSKRRLPAIYPFGEMVEAGGLMYYGAPLAEMYRRAAAYVDKILKGAKASELPVEQPTQFELAINLNTAKALGLAIPASVMIQATRIIK